jgi:glutathione S-transferase
MPIIYTLYGNRLCPYVHRVLMVAVNKNIPLRLVDPRADSDVPVEAAHLMSAPPSVFSTPAASSISRAAQKPLLFNPPGDMTEPDRAISVNQRLSDWTAASATLAAEQAQTLPHPPIISSTGAVSPSAAIDAAVLGVSGEGRHAAVKKSSRNGVEGKCAANGLDLPPWYLMIDPRGRPPTLQIGKTDFVHDSFNIAQYLDDAYFPPHSLFPPVPAARARVRTFQEICGRLVGAFRRCLEAPPAQLREHQLLVRRALHNAETFLASQPPSPFVLGSAPSLADVAIAPFLDRFRYVLPAYCDFDPLQNDAPHLMRTLRAMELEPCFQVTAARPEDYLEYYRPRAKGKQPRMRRRLIAARGALEHPVCYAAQLAAFWLRIDVTVEDANEAHAVLPFELDVGGDWTIALCATGQPPATDVGVLQFLGELSRRSEGQQEPAAVEAAHGRYVVKFMVTAIEQARQMRDAGKGDAAMEMQLRVLNQILATPPPRRPEDEGPFVFGRVFDPADAVVVPFLAKVPAAMLERCCPVGARLLNAARSHPEVSKWPGWAIVDEWHAGA